MTEKYKKHRGGDPSREFLVEGPDDFHFLFQWLSRAELLGEFCFRETSGIDELLKVLPVVLKESELRCLGVIADANGSVEARWQGIRDRLVRSGYEAALIPAKAPGEGFVLDQPGFPRIGIWIMPDNVQQGYLENFVATLIGEKDPLWPKAVQAVNDIPAGEQRFPEIHRAKAQIHTWLAWQEVPGLPMGLAVRERYLQAESPAGRSFQEWITRFL